jgi:phosphotransferase system enzyme I (PtsP)
VILEEGSLTAHVVIVARAMGIPVVGRVRALRGKCAMATSCCSTAIRA